MRTPTPHHVPSPRGAKRGRHEGWAEVRAALAAAERGALLALIRDLYQAGPDNRRFLRARLLGGGAGIEGYRRLVVEAIAPDPFSRRPVRIAEAKRLIRHFEKATADLPGTVDLWLSAIEAGTAQAADLGYGADAYFAALCAMVERVDRAREKLSSADRDQAGVRLREVADLGRAIGWGYGDYLCDVAARWPASGSPSRGSAGVRDRAKRPRGHSGQA